jgi:tRNA-splicing ligase RtcB
MRTDVIIYASKELIDQIRKDQSLEQAMNVATLPGIVGYSLAMPDIHQGYGFPIGGVAATDSRVAWFRRAAWASTSTAASGWSARI